jgi:pyruvate formate lyase activating enzyme
VSALILFTAPGCLRCRVARAFLNERSLPFEELDFQGEGREAFQRFYREHRADIRRGPDGVEFPILHDGERVVQGVGEIAARLQAGDRLAGFVGSNTLGQGWIDGLDVSAGDPAAGGDFLSVLRHLKAQGLRTELRADGRNGDLLERVIEEGLADRLVFDPVGPAEVYEAAFGAPLSEEALRRSLALAARAPEVRFVLTLRPLSRPGGEGAWLTPEEAARAAELTAEATGNRQLPFLLRAGDPPPGEAPLPKPALFKIRTACRRHMPKTDLKNGVTHVQSGRRS